MKILINNIDYSKNFVYPLKVQYALDESLDQGVLTLKNMVEEEPFEPLSLVLIDNERWLVGIDNVEQKAFGKEPRYEHIINLIEETKLLEKYFVDTCTTTNPLDKYATLNQPVYPNITVYEYSVFDRKTPPKFKNDPNGIVFGYVSPIQQGTNFIFKKFTDIFDDRIGTPFGGFYTGYGRMKIYKNGNVLYDTGFKQYEDGLPSYQINLEKGEYTVTYTYRYDYTIYWDTSYSFKVVETIGFREDLTITDVINKLLLLAEIPRRNGYSIFKLNDEQYSEFQNLVAPEFNISNCTLREALNKVGGYIHSQARLNDGIIYFDKYNSNKDCNIKKNHVAYTSSQDIEQFCSEIESNAKNLVPDEEFQGGQLVEPYSNGYITTRTETGNVLVDDSTAYIPTKFKIQNLIKLEMGFIDDTTKVGDITSYCKEKSIYSTLSSYSDTPRAESKAYNIYWEQGQKGIKGLNFELPDIFGGAFNNYAITNIVNDKLGTSYGDFALPKLQFRITYSPLVDIRVKQSKPYLKSTLKRATSAYNQSDYKMSSTYYGENMQGVVARLGNIEKLYTYIFNKNDELPKTGQIFDEDYIISIVKVEYLNNFNKVTIALSKDFNRLNEFVGINNEQRFYEISEKGAVERYCVYQDYVVIGDEVPLEEAETNPLAQIGMLYELRNRFKGRLGEFNGVYRRKVTNVVLDTYDKALNKITTNSISLPVLAFPFGNSACFFFSFNNNYGAGDYIGYFQSDSKAVQNELIYTDRFGEFEYLGFDMYSIPYYSGESYDPVFSEPQNYDDAVRVGSALPKEEIPNGMKRDIAPLISTKDYLRTEEDLQLDIRKDNRENINITYQINCVTNLKNIVIGSGLAKTLGVTEWGADDGEVRAYILNRQISKFENYIIEDLKDEISYSMSASGTSRTLNIGDIIANKNGKSLVFVNDVSKELMFAINQDFVAGKTYKMPSMTLRHKVFVE